MAVLAPGVPHVTDLGFVDVENVLAPGRHRFRLTVFDEARNESEPAFIVVTVNEVQRDPRRDPRVDTRLDPRVVERVVLQPIGGVVRPPRPIIPRRPGG